MRRGRRRAGSWVLSLFVVPLTLPILRALEGGPMRLAELRKAVGLPAQTTLRGRLADLVEIGAIAKRARPDARNAADYLLAPLGQELLDVAVSLETWLKLAPEGPIELESGMAKGAVKALVEGWRSRMVRALATRPLSLTELDRLISGVNYPALERRLGSMRMAGLIEPRPAAGPSTPYAMTDWGRRAIMPLANATRCERIHLASETEAPTPGDFETAFLLALPLAVLPRRTEGWCQLRVEGRRDSGSGPVAGVRVDVEAGRVIGCASRLDPRPRDWAAGSEGRWFDAIEAGDPTQLRLGGGERIAAGLVQGMHAALASRRSLDRHA